MRNELNFGDSAIRFLYENIMKMKGIEHGDLKAKVVGGATVIDNFEANFNIGELNIKVAHKILGELKIPIVGEHVGGNTGRKIYFYSDSGRLRVSQIETRTALNLAGINLKKKVRVLIVDDSKTIKELLRKILTGPDLEVVGMAGDAVEAEKLIKELKPDVITLDIHMPGMDGVSFLEKFLPIFPIPTVMISSINMNESGLVLRALELGAVDYIQKPTLAEIKTQAEYIREKVITASSIRVITQKVKPHPSAQPIDKLINSSEKIVALGASTGGTEALKEVLLRLPANIPPILIVQHIPPIFSEAFAKRLNEICPFEVIEGKDGDEIIPGRVIVAPGGKHMEIQIEKGIKKVKIYVGERVNRHIPSVDVLFNSVAKELRENALGVILTGMGNDGASGLLKMKKAGALTIGQDEKSSVVFGMPKAAQAINAVTKVISLENIADEIIRNLE